MQKDFSNFTDTQVLEGLTGLDIRDTHTTAERLLYLLEVERRGIYRNLGYSSMFAFCCEAQRYSEPVSYTMLSSARVIGRFPELMELFLKREVTTTTLSRVSGIITEENKKEIISRMTGATSREVEELVADYRPTIPLKEHVKPVRVVRKAKRAAAKKAAVIHSPVVPAQPAVEERVEFKFSLPKEAREKFDELKALLSGRFPLGVSVADVFDEALSIAVEKLSPKRRLERKARRAAPLAIKVNSPKVLKSRYVPRPVRDTVYVRDGGCCTYVSADGKRCGSKHCLQYHHRDAYARGGTNDAENISLMCATHNMLLAEQEFGRAHMQKFKRGGG